MEDPTEVHVIQTGIAHQSSPGRASLPRQSVTGLASFQFGRTSTHLPPHLLHLLRRPKAEPRTRRGICLADDREVPAGVLRQGEGTDRTVVMIGQGIYLC